MSFYGPQSSTKHCIPHVFISVAPGLLWAEPTFAEEVCKSQQNPNHLVWIRKWNQDLLLGWYGFISLGSTVYTEVCSLLTSSLAAGLTWQLFSAAHPAQSVSCLSRWTSSDGFILHQFWNVYDNWGTHSDVALFCDITGLNWTWSGFLHPWYLVLKCSVRVTIQSTWTPFSWLLFALCLEILRKRAKSQS